MFIYELMDTFKLEKEFDEFLDNIPNKLKFSVMLYPKTEKSPIIIRFKFGINRYMQAALKCNMKNYEKFLKNRNIKLYFTGLFRKNMIKGDITLLEILHDAEAVNPTMSSFFTANKNSKYGNTLGIHCGSIKAKRENKGLILKIEDMNKADNISGLYTLKETGRYADFYGIPSKGLYLKKC